MLDDQTKQRHDPSQNLIVNIAMLHNLGWVALLAWFIVEFVRYYGDQLKAYWKVHYIRSRTISLENQNTTVHVRYKTHKITWKASLKLAYFTSPSRLQSD